MVEISARRSVVIFHEGGTEMNKEIIDGVTRHLIVSGLTFNAENAIDPVVIRPMKVEVLVATVLEYLIGAGYAEATKVS